MDSIVSGGQVIALSETGNPMPEEVYMEPAGRQMFS
jgi:hypothetical protein